MTSDEIAKRFVACERWRWMPGMVAIFDEEEGGCRCRIDGDKGVGNADHARDAEAEPLLTDPATPGCIEHGLLADIYGPECTLWHWCTSTLGGYCYGRHGMAFGSGPTKAAALVDALETKS